MIPLIPAVISAIPSIFKLFSSDERKEGVGELTATVLGEASKALGVNLKTKDELVSHLNANPEHALKLKDIELNYEIKIKELTLEDKKEDNRSKEAHYKEAHETYRTTHDMADIIAQQVVMYNLPVIGILVFINVLLVYYMQDNASLIAIASNIIGVAIGNLFNERNTIVNFFFGSSQSSKTKDDTISQIKK